MATNWEAKFGKGKWVTVRGARVYIQEGKGLGAALQKLAGKKKTIKSPERKIPKLDDSAKKIIGKNEKTIVNAKKKFGVRMNSIVDQVGDENNKDAYVALGKARAAREINRELKGRNPDGNWGGTGAADYNNKKEPRAFAWDRNLLQSHERRVKEGILDAQKARKAAGTDGKLRSPIYADEKSGKLKLASKPLGNGKKSFTNEKDRKEVENNVVKRNEETIKKYNQTDPNTDWEEFVKINDAARHARNENQKIKAKNEPGRGQTISDYRNPQFTKGDNLSPVGNRHVTSRVTPDASKTGEADQELNQLYAQRRPYGNRTYNDPTLKGSWEDSVKTVIKNARATRKANGTEGKLRSDVYKSAPAMTPKAETAKKQKPVAQEKSGEVKKINLLGDLKNREDQNKALFTAPIDKNGRLSLGNGSALRYGKGELKFREAADALKSGKTTGSLEEKILTGKIKNGKLVNKDGTTITLSKYDLEMRKAYDAVKKENKTPSLKSALQEKVGKKTRKK